MTRSFKLLLLGPLCIIGGIAMTVAGLMESGSAGQLASEGVTAKARIDGHRTISGRRGSKTYKLAVTFEPEGRGSSVSKGFTVPEPVFQSAPDGQEIEVRYLPSDPEVAQLAGAEISPMEKIGPGVLLMIVGAVIAFFVFRSRARARLQTI